MIPNAAGRRLLTRVERAELRGYVVVIVALHLVGWGLVYLAARASPFLIGLAGLAYSFGLRHAFDADHIAAIDNTTRNLMAGEKRPLGVGFFFSLGHSTIVFGLTLAIALAARAVTLALPEVQALGVVLGTMISGVFLYVIGIVNLLVMVDLWRVFRAAQRDGADAHGPEAVPGGLMSRWFRRVFGLVRRPGQMYWVGLLFGLGFDTATEIGLLTSAGVAAVHALPLWSILALPLVFAAGMSLLDTTDGVLMCGAYGWAMSHPLRKIFYNLSVTGLSVVVALFIGTVELVSITTDRLLNLHTGIWAVIQGLSLQAMGLAVTGLFLVAWAASAAIWRFGRLGREEVGT